MNSEKIIFLEKFYNKYRDSLELQKKYKYRSLILSSLEVKNNVRFKLLCEAILSAEEIPQEILINLIDDHLIQETDDVNKYVITAKGIWEIEKRNKVLTDNKIIEYIDKKMFNLFTTGKTLSEKEKIIMLSLIAIRAFSEKSSMNLHTDDMTKDTWKNVIEKTYDFLQSMKIIQKMKKEELFGKKEGNENPISNFIRHSDSLPRKSKNIYTILGKQTYFLNIFSNGIFSNDKLRFLWKLIFEDNLDADQIEKVLTFIKQIAHDDSIMIFSIKDHIFSTPVYDEIIQKELIHSMTD